MQKIKTTVNCVNCGEEIEHFISNLDDEASIHIMCFEDAWECNKCGHTTLFADLEGIDAEDL